MVASFNLGLNMDMTPFGAHSIFDQASRGRPR